MESALEMKAELGDLSGFEGDVGEGVCQRGPWSPVAQDLGLKKATTHLPPCPWQMSPCLPWGYFTCVPVGWDCPAQGQVSGLGSYFGPPMILCVMMQVYPRAHTHMHIPGF